MRIFSVFWLFLIKKPTKNRLFCKKTANIKCVASGKPRAVEWGFPETYGF
jgi:hypothetical protein